MGLRECCGLSSTFPLGVYFCLWLTLIPNCISISFIFPFLGFFVLHLDLVEEKGKVGGLVGLIVSVNPYTRNPPTSMENL